jgi:hypothetical protein
VLADFQLPPRAPRPSGKTLAGPPVSPYLSAQWTPEALAELAAALGTGGAVLREIPDSALLDAWDATVHAFLDPGSPERRDLTAPLAAMCALSPAGLDAGLTAVLGGVRRPHAAALFERAWRSAAAASATPLVVVVLASNLPALAVQPLLPALALRRPVLLKSPSAEPLFAPAFLAALVLHEPRLASAVAAVTWSGGDAELEAPLLAAAGTVVAYGGSEALADLARRAPAKLLAYGPMTSVAAIDMTEGELASVDAGDGASLTAVAAGLARDVALFDQRGCLSIAAVYVGGGLDAARRLAGHLQAALAELAVRWPPGPAPAPALAAVQQARLEAEMRGLWSAGHTFADLPSAAVPSTAPAPGARPRGALPLAAGTVLVEPDAAFHPSPGLRTVRVHPLPELDRLPKILAPWRGRLQGAALAGPAAWRLAPRLAELGVSRCTAPGELQSADAAWHNGGIDPLAALAEAAGKAGRSSP